MPHDRTYHDEDTLILARESLKRHGLNGSEIIRILSNAGILLRERGPQDAQEPAERPKGLTVACKVAIPLASVTDALIALQEVPIHARLGQEWTRPQGCRCPISSDTPAPRIVARWEESR